MLEISKDVATTHSNKQKLMFPPRTKIDTDPSINGFFFSTNHSSSFVFKFKRIKGFMIVKEFSNGIDEADSFLFGQRISPLVTE